MCVRRDRMYMQVRVGGERQRGKTGGDGRWLHTFIFNQRRWTQDQKPA